MYFTNVIDFSIKKISIKQTAFCPRITNLVYNPSVNRYKIFYFYHVSLCILLKLTEGNLESFCVIQNLLGSQCAAVCQGIHNQIDALLQYGGKSHHIYTSIWWQEPKKKLSETQKFSH